MNIRVLTHSSIRIETSSGEIIYIDPFQADGTPHDADYILITHDHYDHFSPEDIEKILKTDTVLVCPETMREEAESIGKPVTTVTPNAMLMFSSFKILSVPAYNINKKFHPKENKWVGYVLVLDGETIYIAGDTDATEDARKVKCSIALVPIGGTYTMTAKEAAELINEIKPVVAIPTHYGNIVGKRADADEFAKMVKVAKVEIKMEGFGKE